MPIKGVKLCGAKCRTKGGNPCSQPGMKNGRCKMHGGVFYKKETHGCTTLRAKAERNRERSLLKEMNRISSQIEENINEKNNDLINMGKWQFWHRALLAGEQKGKLKNFSDFGEEKCYLHKRMRDNKATASEIIRLSFLMGATSKKEYDEFLDICARYDIDNENI